MRLLRLLIVVLSLAGVSAEAQTASATERSSWTVGTALQSGRDPGAFFLEALGGTAGSLLGMGLVGLASHCGVEDLACLIKTVGAAGAAGVVGSTIGVSLVARATGSRRSIPGAVLGAVVGTGFGLGIHYVLNEGSDRNVGDAIVIPIFTLSQGTIAALGSRLLGK